MTVDPALLLSREAVQDPYPGYRCLQELGPVQRIGDSDFFAVSSWDGVEEAVKRSDDFSSNLTATMIVDDSGALQPFEIDPVGGPTHVLATADDPLHAVHRKLLVPQLAAKRVTDIETFVIDAFTEHWRRGLRDNAIEWMSAVADVVPMRAVVRLIGAPDTDSEQLGAWGYESSKMADGLLTSQERQMAAEAVGALIGYIDDLLARTVNDPGDNLVGDLARAYHSGDIDSFAAHLIMVTLFSAGGESTASLLGSATMILATRPELQSQLRAHPEQIPMFVEETLRYESPFRGHYRHVLRDTELQGVELPANSHLLLLWGAANRDPHHFVDAGEFRLDRPDAKRHIAFGKGVHLCVGAALARLEAATVLRMLLEGTTWVEAVDVGPWLPSILVRRLAHLRLKVNR